MAMFGLSKSVYGSGKQVLVWNNTAGKWAAATVLTTVPGFLSLADVVTTGVSGGFVPVYGATVGPGGTPGVHFINPATLITVSALSQVGDVAYPTGGAGSIPANAYLQWNGSAWVPSTSAVSVRVESLSNGPGALSGKHGQIIRVNSVESALEYVPNTLANLSDVTVSEGPSIDGYVLAWNNGAGCWQPIAHASNSLSALTDVTVTEGSGIDGWFLSWKNSDAKWEAKQLAAVAVSGAYGDLTGKPTLFSGAYADLSGAPSLAAVATTGNYSDLSGKPSLATVATTGAYSDLTGKPTIPTTIESLSDVQVTSVANGQALVWNSTDSKWENGNVAATASLSALTDVQLTSQSNGQALIWNATASKWENGTVSTATALSALTDVNVTEGSGIDGYVLYWKNADTKWEAKAIAAVAASGAYSDLTGKPTIPTTLAALTGDVNITEGSGINGYFLKWDNATSKWVADTPSGGSASLAGLTDVNVSEGSGIDGYFLKWNNATSKWVPTALPVVISTLMGLSDVVHTGAATG